jgi:hypothetical protein
MNAAKPIVELIHDDRLMEEPKNSSKKGRLVTARKPKLLDKQRLPKSRNVIS